MAASSRNNGAKLQSDRTYDIEHSVRTHLHAGTQRLVENHATNTHVFRHLGHLFGLGHLANGTLDLCHIAIGQYL
jgi:hypothetical protein